MDSREKRNIKTKKVKKKKLNVSRTLVVVLFIYLVVCVVLYLYKEPVKHFEISGNTIISDADILRELNFDEYPPYVSVQKHKAEKKLKKNKLIKNAKIKYGFNFTIKIIIEENKPMFISKSDDQICLADGTLIDYSGNYVGIPILLNNTPSEVMKMLAKNLSEIDDGIFYMINDIEYKPSYNSDKQVIDEYRFLLSMNDKNLVFVNAKRLKPLNRYLDVIATTKITDEGIFYLDGDENRYPFKVFHSTTTVPVEEETDEE